MNHDQMILENKRRLEVLNSEYNPIIGIGSPIERQKIVFNDLDSEIYLPIEMFNQSEWINTLAEFSSVTDFANSIDTPIEHVHELFMHERFIYDFEFWCAATIIIQDKITLQELPFILRKAQLKLFKVLEAMRIMGVPIRVVLLKARQWGGSTLVQFYMMWIQTIHKENWHLAICAQDDGAAGNISEMYRRAATYYPPEIGRITFRPYARSPKNIVNNERGGIIGVGSINNPNQFRSYNYPMVHISEPGVWEDTPKRTAAKLVSSLRSTVPRVSYSMIVLESTAKGVGNFFHDEWLSAIKGESGYTPVFVPWYEIDMYQTPIKESEYIQFIETMSDHDKFAWDKGATLEGIKWYNEYQRAEKYEESQMFEEFPTTPEEAFVSTGSRVFPYAYISNARKTVRKPSFIGDIYPSGIANKSALENIEFHESLNGTGNFKVWKKPEPFIVHQGKKWFVTNRYCGFADIGGTNTKADYSCLKIIDRIWMLWGGVPETAALYHCHMDQDLFSWKCAQIGRWYHNMLLAIESNSLKTEKASGDYFLTVLDNIAAYYDNLFIRNNHESINTDYIPKYGFQTNSASKDMILSELISTFRGDVNGNPLYNERDEGTLDECDWYERKPDGSTGAVSGKKDDKTIITAGSVWLANKYMQPPALIPYIEPGERRRTTGKTIVSEASM